MATDVIVLNNLGGGQSCQVDRLPLPGDTVKGYHWKNSVDAGKGPNSCIAMSRLGIRTAFIGKAGKDAAGDRGERWMQEAGVDTSGLLRSDEVMTGQGIRIVEKSGNNLIICGESSSRFLRADEVEREIRRLQPATFFCTGFEIRPELVLKGLDTAKVCGMTTVLNLSPIPSEPLPKLSDADYIVINEMEAAAICSLRSWRDIPVRALAQKALELLGCQCIVITLGAFGSAGMTQGGRFWKVAPVKVNCVDTSGAGDGYLSAMVANLVWGKDIADACRWAGAYSSYTTTRQGTLPSYPPLVEVESFIQGLGL